MTFVPSTQKWPHVDIHHPCMDREVERHFFPTIAQVAKGTRGHHFNTFLTDANTVYADCSAAMSSRASSASSASITAIASPERQKSSSRQRGSLSRPRRQFGPPEYNRSYCVKRFDFEFRFNNIERRVRKVRGHRLFACHRCKYKFCQTCDIHTCKPSQRAKLRYTFGVLPGQVCRRGKIELRWRNVQSCSHWRRTVHWAQMAMSNYSRQWIPLILTVFLWRLLRMLFMLFSVQWGLEWVMEGGFFLAYVAGIDQAVDYGEHWGITRPKWRT